MAITPFFEFANFAVSNVTSSSFTSSTTTLTIANPSNFSAPAANQRVPSVLWNYSDYPGSPMDDPLREILYITDITGSTATASRAQEGTSGANSIAGKTYRIAAVMTKAVYESLAVPTSAASIAADYIFNNNGSATTVFIDSDDGSTDSGIGFRDNNATREWRFGIDISDSQKLKVGKGSSLGSNTFLTFDYDNGRVGFLTDTPAVECHVNTSSDPTFLRVSTTATNGDAGVQVKNDVQTWTLGVDGSDSDKFKLSSGSALGTADRIVVGTGGAIGFSVDPTSAEIQAKFTNDPTRFLIESTATDGDAAFQVKNDAETWTIGVDGSDSDTFKISDGSTVEVAPILKAKTGQFYSALIDGAPADAELWYVNGVNGSIAWYLNQSGNTLLCKVKYDDGTVKTLTAGLGVS